MSNDTPNYSMPPHMIEAWRRLNEFAAKWPKLANSITSIHSINDVVFMVKCTNESCAALQALAREHKDVGKWMKRRNRYGTSWFDYEVVIDGITLVLPMAEPIHLEYESCEIKWEEKTV